jgi:molybdenum cofactor guanylyltransferase
MKFRAILVPAGGQSRRLGYNKLTAPLGTASVLGNLLTDLQLLFDRVPIIVLGPKLADVDGVWWTHEDPVGGGPVAGLAAGLRLLTTGPDLTASRPTATSWIAVVAGDQPFAASGLQELACAVGQQLADPAQAHLAVDAVGRPQPLLGIYRPAALGQAIAADGHDQSVRSVTAQLRVRLWSVDPHAIGDVDTAADLSWARTELQRRRKG